MRRLNNGFYQSKAWKRCRESYIKSKGGLCEMCLSAGLIKAGRVVHHKTELTEENCGDPNISLNFDNLMLLCHSCHEAIHQGKKCYGFDAEGNLFKRR